MTRAFNHFHNPLAAQWEDAGLRASSLFGLSPLRGQSSVLWQQNATQDTSLVYTPLPTRSGGGKWSWQDARERYLTALTGTVKGPSGDRIPIPKDQREKAFAETFEALGHLSHLIQDASVPAHTRNDPHPLYEGYEAWVEAMRRGGSDRDGRERRPVFLGLLDREPVKSTVSLLTPTGNAEAPVPIARLIDANVFGGLNVDALTGPAQGMAEYANGNFVSGDTTFADFALPRREALGLGFSEPEGRGQRLYFPKERDGEPVRHFVAEGSFFQLLLSQGLLETIPNYILTDRVYEDYARLLIPRGVGYSAGHLDYFFRGKLDLDLVEDPDNPAWLRLTGTNGSSEPLVDGALSLYADDPAGVRTPVPGATSIAVSGVGPGQEVFTSPVTFQAPESTERFVAVYQGTLGQEVKDPARNFSGAVIGQVLGGVRVEEVFSDGGRWYLRTPQGVYPLPISGQDIVELRWGDRDNTLVGRSYFGPGQPNQFFAYEIARPVGSTGVPLRTESDGSQVVDVRLLRQVPFPFGLDLGTTIEFTQTIQYQQYLLSYVTTATGIFDHCEGAGGACFYRFQDFTVSDGQATLMVNETRPVTRRYPVSLDPGKLARWTPPYLWDLREIGLTSEGQLLALVVVRLTSPEEAATFPAFTLTVDLTGGNSGTLVPQPVPTDPVPVPLSFPSEMGPVLWALVDVGAGRVVASTAPELLTINHTTPYTNLYSRPGVVAALEFRKLRFLGGPAEGYIYNTSGPVPTERFPSACPPPDLANVQPLAEVSLQSGTLAATLAQYRPELAPWQFPSPTEDEQPIVDQYLFLCRSTDGVSAGFTVTTNRRGFRPSRLEQVLRSGPGAGPGQLAILVAQSQAGGGGPIEFVAAAAQASTNGGGGDHANLVAWLPGFQQATLRQTFSLGGSHWITAVSPRGALVISELTDGSGATTLVPLEGPGASVVFPDIQLTSFLLLAPDYLYNPEDLRFYRKRPPLQRTALPAPLAPVSGNPVGAYHIVPAP